MQLAHWRYEILDLDKQSGLVERTDFSFMANAVELLNLHLLADLANRDTPTTVLEIGCGAHSLVQQKLSAPSTWEGIDVIEYDRKGRPSLATRKASVEDIPWPNSTFDVVLSNQSIEHWYEYGVGFQRALLEIRRVLRVGGCAVINFPVHLHGHRVFLVGDFAAIDQAFTNAGLVVERRVAVVKSCLSAYRGWRACGFPDFVVSSLTTHEATSYVVEYTARKLGSDSGPLVTTLRKPGVPLSLFRRHLHYGLRYLVWKMCARLLRRDRVGTQ